MDDIAASPPIVSARARRGRHSERTVLPDRLALIDSVRAEILKDGQLCTVSNAVFIRINCAGFCSSFGVNH
ncbi:MAG: hypothetical protein WBE76_26270 [Terracidiphilus sp.]